VTLLMDMGNISHSKLMFSRFRFLEATLMPRPLSVPLRQEIVRRHQQGLPLTQIAADLAIPYGTVRKIWRLYRQQGLERLTPDYGGLGRPVPPSTQELLRIACDLKRDHPTWGAGLIRLKLRKHAHDAPIPSIRNLQVAFVRAGVHRPRRRRAPAVVVPQAVHPHEVWQVDAVENVPLATGQRICWLTVTDEASGAILATEVSPPTAAGNTSPRRRSRRCSARSSSPGACPIACGSTTAIPGAPPATSPPSWRYG